MTDPTSRPETDDAGWTDVGISRNDRLRCIDNGVVPQQAVAALQWLLSVAEVAT